MTALYEEDFVLWTEKTAELLKRKEFDLVDWENLIEEVECMGKSDRRAVESLLTQLLIHLLKLSYWESEKERNARHWLEEIANWLFSTLCDNFCLWNPEALIGQDF